MLVRTYMACQPSRPVRSWIETVSQLLIVDSAVVTVAESEVTELTALWASASADEVNGMPQALE